MSVRLHRRDSWDILHFVVKLKITFIKWTPPQVSVYAVSRVQHEKLLYLMCSHVVSFAGHNSAEFRRWTTGNMLKFGIAWICTGFRFVSLAKQCSGLALTCVQFLTWRTEKPQPANSCFSCAAAKFSANETSHAATPQAETVWWNQKETLEPSWIEFWAWSTELHRIEASLWRSLYQKFMESWTAMSCVSVSVLRLSECQKTNAQKTKWSLSGLAETQTAKRSVKLRRHIEFLM